MAEANTSSKKSGLTRGKAILIGVLSIVLVAILYIQFGGGAAKPVGESDGYRPSRPAVAVQPANSSSNQVTLASAKTPANTQSSKAKDAAAALIIDQARWKSPRVETIAAFDPFALPPAFPQLPKVAVGAKGKDGKSLIAEAAENDAKKLADAVEKLHMQLEELTQRGVHVIIQDGDQYATMIGDRLLHVGDKINEFTITAIDPDGFVHVEKKESP